MFEAIKEFLLKFAVIVLVASMCGCNQRDNRTQEEIVKVDYSEDKDTCIASFESAFTELREMGVYIPLAYVNKTDKNGKKHGIWIEKTIYGFIYYTYKNGVKDGPEIWYHSRANKIKISTLTMFKNGNMKEILMFGDDGLIIDTTQDIEENNRFQEFKRLFPYMGYEKSFTNGKIERAGDVIFNENWEIDFEEIGDWKYYDDEGNCIVKNLQPYGYLLP